MTPSWDDELALLYPLGKPTFEGCIYRGGLVYFWHEEHLHCFTPYGFRHAFDWRIGGPKCKALREVAR